MAKTAKDKFLDAPVVIQAYGMALDNHHLDEVGYLEKLQAAARHCLERGREAMGVAERYTALHDAYSIAQGLYYVALRERMEASGGTFYHWFRDCGGSIGVGVSYSLAYRLMRVALSPNPAEELNRRRRIKRVVAKTDAIKRRAEKQATILAVESDPLTLIKREWRKLSPVQQDAFYLWARKQLHAAGRNPK